IQTTFGSEVGIIYFANFDAVMGSKGTNIPTTSHGWLFIHRTPVRNSGGFYLYPEAWHFFFFLPYLRLVAASAVISGLPWIKFRISLRTMLIATTLIALALGTIAIALR